MLNGRKAVVIGGHSAGKIIVSARTSGSQWDEAGISLFLVDPSAAGVKRRVFPTIDGRKACELFLDNVQVAASDLQPGDLVFYYSPISHVGIYIGNGQIVHAANPSTGVQVTGGFSGSRPASRITDR